MAVHLREGVAEDYPEDVLFAQDAAEIVLRHIGDLTTKDTLGAVPAKPIEDGWVVGVEIVELPRIPCDHGSLNDRRD